MAPRARSSISGLLLAALALGLGAGCGGLAADGPGGDDLPVLPDDGPVPDEAAADELAVKPESFEVLELRRMFDDPVPGGPAWSCDFAQRWKVNMETGHLIVESCQRRDNGYGGSGSTKILDALELASVRLAYGRLRAGRTGVCVRSLAVYTLALEVERDEVLFADEDHSACPAPGAEGSPSLAGIDDLLTLLMALAAE